MKGCFSGAKNNVGADSFHLKKRTVPIHLCIVLLTLAGVPTVPATTWYVATSGHDTADGTTWATAKQTIQAAIDVAVSNDTVMVSNGVYATGGRVVYGAMTSRVAITKAITVQSVNGPSATAIRGTGPSGNAAVRCVYVGTNAVLSGFTLTNGATRSNGDVDLERSGGGAWCETSGLLSNCILTGNSAWYGAGSAGGTLRNCTLTGNSAADYGGASSGSTLSYCTLSGNSAGYGGGSWEGTLNHCTLTNNLASWSGGGSYHRALSNCTLTGNLTYYGYGGGSCYGTLNNCVVIHNVASYGSGGGSFEGTLNSCTLAENSATWFGGGSCFGTLNNCIVYYNTARECSNYYSGTLTYCCSDPLPAGDGNITNAPMFVATNAGNYRLQAGSPCVDTGTNQTWMSGAMDLGGRPRIINDRVDMGAYEYVWIHFVSLSGSHVTPYTNWFTAATNIQAAIDVAAVGDTVLVTNGIYNTGGRVVYGAMTNRIAITNAVTVQSVNGPAFTVVEGSGPIGDSAVRCAYIGTNAVLSGFTLTNGSTRADGDVDLEQSGGGAWGESSGILSNCILTGNSAWYGGGSFEGILNRCTLIGNSAADYGGGSAGGMLNNCIFIGNSAAGYGGGSVGGTLNNCTLSGNSAGFGGGSASGTLNNCIVYYNTAPSSPNHTNCAFICSCTTPAPAGAGNITNDPQFVDMAANNYRLGANSPCIDQGDNAYAQGATDLDGNPRVVSAMVDMGAYEVQTLFGYWLWASAIKNGLTNYTDFSTGDGYPNLLKYAAGSSATNADNVADITTSLSNKLFVLCFNRNTNALDTTLIVESTFAMTNNAQWTGIATNTGGSWGGATNIAEAATGTPVTVRLMDYGPATRRFLRLRVTRP